jgi:hypothetical protein
MGKLTFTFKERVREIKTIDIMSFGILIKTFS